MDNEKNLNEVPENNISLDENIVNSINLLVAAAKKTPREEEITRLEQELKELETKKEEYTQELEEEFKQDKKNLNDKVLVVKKVVNQKIGLYRNNIESMTLKLEEYEQDIKEQESKMEEEKRQLEELEKLPKTRENMIKKAELEWGILAYEEYLEFMYNEVEELKSSILITKEKIQKLKERVHAELDKDVRMFNAKYNIEYGNSNPTFTNNELLIQMGEEINKKEEEINYYKQDPETIKAEIIEDMKNGVEGKVVREKLETLTSLIGGQVTGIIDLKEIETFGKQLEKLAEEKSNVEKRINEDNYIDQEAVTHDKELMDKYKEDMKTYHQELKRLEDQLEIHEQQRELPRMKRELRSIEKFIKKADSQQKLMRKYGKERAASFSRIVTDFEKDKRILEQEIKELEEKPKVTFTSEIKREINEYKTRIKTRERKIAELSKKTDADYIDLGKKSEDLFLLDAINYDIEVLKDKQQALNEHDPYQLIEQIIDKYQEKTLENQEEEIFSFKDATKALVEKIKSSEFTRKSKNAISNIASIFKKKTQKEEFDYNQLTDNVSNAIPEEYNNEQEIDVAVRTR